MDQWDEIFDGPSGSPVQQAAAEYCKLIIAERRADIARHKLTGFLEKLTDQEQEEYSELTTELARRFEADDRSTKH